MEFDRAVTRSPDVAMNIVRRTMEELETAEERLGRNLRVRQVGLPKLVPCQARAVAGATVATTQARASQAWRTTLYVRRQMAYGHYHFVRLRHFTVVVVHVVSLWVPALADT